ncbi:sperm microtubule inner protein 6 [Phaenicophaeus curvirostris]|uniref:sperm microtubule inner protein 6 n=1 Tax=Phaenicophaeus curvirostris TaxID=33595 RepID=UPI0037F0FED1
MFLFSRKYKTPISTYTDHYRPPHTIRKTINDHVYYHPWNTDKFVTKGLTLSRRENAMTQGEPEKYNTHANSSASHWPEYCLTRTEEKYNPVVVNEDKQITWITGPYHSTTWNKQTSYINLQPKETKVETFLHSVPVPCCLDQFEEEMVTETMPVCAAVRKGPFQGYYSLCSARHYCPRGMECYVDGIPFIRGHFHIPEERAVRLGWSIWCCSYSPTAILCTSTCRPQPLSMYMSPRWDSSNFSMVEGIKRGSYVIDPKFTSEGLYDPDEDPASAKLQVPPRVPNTSKCSRGIPSARSGPAGCRRRMNYISQREEPRRGGAGMEPGRGGSSRPRNRSGCGPTGTPRLPVRPAPLLRTQLCSQCSQCCRCIQLCCHTHPSHGSMLPGGEMPAESRNSEIRSEVCDLHAAAMAAAAAAWPCATASAHPGRRVGCSHIRHGA